MRDKEGIISLQTFVRHNDNVVLIMPFFEHDVFQDYINRITINEVQQYMRALFLSLKVVHSYHIIHRDIKPSNFLYNFKNKTFKLIDFGLAQMESGYGKRFFTGSFISLPCMPFTSQKHEDLYTKPRNAQHHSSSKLMKENCSCIHSTFEVCSICQSRPTQKCSRAGTSGFRAPEVLLKHSNQTTAVDVWSAGVILLSLLSGRYPFFQAHDDLSAMMQLVALFGSTECEQAAKNLGKDFCCLPSHPAQNLRVVCQNLRSRISSALSENTCSTSASQTDSRELLAYDLLQKCLDLTPSIRITATQALNHQFIKDIV